MDTKLFQYNLIALTWSNFSYNQTRMTCVPTHTGTSHCSCRWNCWHCCQSNAAGEGRADRTSVLARPGQRACAWQWGSRTTPPGHRWNGLGRGAPRWGSDTQETATECSVSLSDCGPHCGRAEREQVAQSQKTQETIIGQSHSNETLYSVVSRPSNDSHWPWKSTEIKQHLGLRRSVLRAD